MRRLGGARADQENAERLLNGENVVAVFPEGLKGSSKLYHKKYQLQRFGRGGFVKLALRTRAPIIPAAIVGSEDVHPLLGKVTKVVRTMGVSYLPLTPTFPWLGPLGLLPLPVKWNIELCEPISVDAYADGADSDPELVNELSEQVRQAIQRKLDDNLRLRQSILFG
jgi:1-acyl-sn-glycerol-3-phosphate acyltransferase